VCGGCGVARQGQGRGVGAGQMVGGGGVVVGGGWLLACYAEPIKSGAKVGTSDASLTSNSPLIIFEYSMVVVFFELRNVDLKVPLDSERQLFVVWFI
jgi:hypothetical protein